MDAEGLKAEIAALEKNRARGIAMAQQAEGAIAFARYLLEKVEAKADDKPNPEPSHE